MAILRLDYIELCREYLEMRLEFTCMIHTYCLSNNNVLVSEDEVHNTRVNCDTCGELVENTSWKRTKLVCFAS